VKIIKYHIDKQCLKSFKLIILTVFFVSSFTGYSQIEKDSTEQIDLPILLRKLFNVEESDSAKKKEKKVLLSILPAIGYTIQTGFTVDVISNNAFQLGDKENTNLSSVTFQVELSQRKQLSMPFNIVIWSPENKWNFVSDWRFLMYHQLNYGLGGSSLIEDEIFINFNYLRVHQTAYREIAKNTYAGVGYNLDYHTKIRQTHIKDNEVNDFSEYGDPSKTLSSGFTLNGLFDKRKNSISPRHGEHYANVIYKNNFKQIGSSSDWSSLFIDLRTYFKLGKSPDNILAFWSYNQFVLGGTPPFLDLPSTGWDAYTNFARQYRQGRYVGKSLLYLESEYRFKISRNGFFNGSVFANGHSVSEWSNNKFKHFIPGVGCSVRLKMNTDSDLNLVVSYGVAADGSQGFFFNLGEAF